jgi:uncharacterized protein (TIGR02444 family)
MLLTMADPDARSSSQGSPFWRFSLAFYRVPNVADACIRLQDEAGVDVNVLFYLLWHAALERRLGREDVVAIEARIGPWREQVVVPLRAIRRAIRTPPPGIEGGTAEAYRTKVKGLELEAERLQQEALYDLAQGSRFGEPAASPEEAAEVNIAAYQTVLARRLPDDATAAVLAAFKGFERRAGADQGAH